MTQAEPAGPDYVREKQTTVALIGELRAILRRVAPDADLAIRPIEDSLSKPIFSVAITGSSRVGKSTLINAMMHRGISPMGVLPTTGIPCTYVPGSEEGIDVVVTGQPAVRTELSATELAKWVTQKKNPENRKHVERVVIHLQSPILNLGLALLDLPGMDDPSDNVRNVTEIALETVDAIVYVLNGETFASGSFLFTRSNKEDLQRLVGRKDKTFVVINKADALGAKQRRELARYLSREFERFQLLPLSEETLFFVSAREAFEARCQDGKHGSDAELASFENSLWKYLLANSAIGRNRLAGTLVEATKLVMDQVAIASLALTKSQKALDLKERLTDFPTLIAEIQRICSSGYTQAVADVGMYLRDEQDRAIERLASSLHAIPIYQPLPSRLEIRSALERYITQMASNAQREGQQRFQKAAGRANAAVDKYVTELWNEISVITRGTAISTLTSDLGFSKQGNLWTPFWGTLGLGLAGALFGPIGLIVGGIIGFLAGLFVDERKRRESETRELVGRCGRILSDAADKIKDELDLALDDAFRELQRGMTSRLTAAEGSLRRELERIGEPLAPERKATITSAITELQSLAGRIRENVEKLSGEVKVPMGERSSKARTGGKSRTRREKRDEEE